MEEEFSAPVAQTLALAALLGTSIGMLCVKGLFDEKDVAFAFLRADRFLPAGAGTDGAEMLDAAREVANKVIADHR